MFKGFKKLLVLIATALSLSACNLLPTLPGGGGGGFFPGLPNMPSSYVDDSSSYSNSSRNTASSDSDGPYSLTLSTNSVEVGIGEQTRIECYATNSRSEAVEIRSLYISFSQNGIDILEENTNYFVFVARQQMSSARLTVNANLVNDTRVSSVLRVTATNTNRLQLSDAGAVTLKKNEYHSTIIQVVNDTTGDQRSIENYNINVEIPYGMSLEGYWDWFRDIKNNRFILLTSFHTSGNAILRVVLFDVNSGYNSCYSEIQFIVQNEEAQEQVQVGVGFDVFIVNQDNNVSVELCKNSNTYPFYQERLKIQDLFVYSENEEVISNISFTNINTKELFSFKMKGKIEGYTRLLFEVKAASGDTFYQIVGIEVVNRDSFWIDCALPASFWKDDKPGFRLNTEYTLTFTTYPRLDDPTFEIVKADFSETTRNMNAMGIKGFSVISTTCSGREATLTFKISDNYNSDYVEIRASFTSNKGYVVETGYGWEVFRG